MNSERTQPYIYMEENGSMYMYEWVHLVFILCFLSLTETIYIIMEQYDPKNP